MPSADASSARPNGSGSTKDELAHYKTQYEQLESELADFQASSRELEAELEKDIEASEKRERQLKEKLDSLRYEVDEWKTKYKQSKSEGGAAQNALQKEITTLRDTNRTLQLKLRDIEVANDDYERQARNTTSSLEDMESKYNVAIERGVLLEEEIKNGEQEREGLRIENQRLRDEFSDLKIETEIVQEKLRNTELHGGRRRKPMPLYRSPSTPHTPETVDRSPRASQYSPIFGTPPTKPSLASSAATPPSPPISEASTSMRKSINATPGFPRQKASAGESLNARSMYGTRSQRYSHSRTSSLVFSNGRSTPSLSSRNSLGKPNGHRPSGLPNSGSLCQIRGLIGKMQKLEERVHSAKSKLPAPSDSPSRTSSRSGSVIGESPIASTIAVRGSTRKRLSGSSFSSSVRDGESVPSYIPPGRHSIGTRTQGDSRPSSRTSFSSRSSFSHSMHPGVAPSARPESRQSRSGGRTPLGHYSTNPTTESRRPRSSLSNNAGQSTPVNGMSYIDENELGGSVRERSNHTRLPSASTLNGSTPSGAKMRSASGMSAIPALRSFKTSAGVDRREGKMGPPDRKSKTNDLGETY